MTGAGALAIGLAAALAACRDPAPAAPTSPTSDDDGPIIEDELGLGRGSDDPEEAPEEERIAAVEHAMNELAPVANQCWAAAATDDYRLAGSVRALVTVGEGGARVEITEDTARDPVLRDCLVSVLEAYPWASPLRGQVIELPFGFRAPAMQNLIDRRLVAHHAQAGLDVAVLIDQNNTGTTGVAILDVRAEPTRAIGPRVVDRTELWRFTSAASVTIGKTTTPLAAGDLVLVPPGATLHVTAVDGAVIAATVALVPGGPMGVARAGALPVALPRAGAGKPALATVVQAAKAKRYPRAGGATTLLVEGGVVSVGLLELDAGAALPSHSRATETEAIYLLEGAGAMTIDGVAVAIDANTVVAIPPGVARSFTATTPIRALQFYTPAGPEQRWKTTK